MSGDYRPRSPDLSALSQQSTRHIPPPSQSESQRQRQPQPQPQPQPPYQPQPPSRSHSHSHSHSTDAYLAPQHRGSYDASPFFAPQGAVQSQSYFPNQPQPQHQPQPHPQQFEQPPYFSSPQQSFPPQPQFTPDRYQYPSYPHPPPYFEQDFNMPPRRRPGGDTDEYLPHGQGAGSQMTGSANGGPSQGIDVRTKFPVARIKRIIQHDEEVGKLSIATPIAVSKALELFMITLVTKAASEARDRSSKRVTAQHLKSAIAKDDTLDFLNEIVEKVPSNPEAKGKTRARSGSPDPAEEGKKKRGPRRKKSEADD